MCSQVISRRSLINRFVYGLSTIGITATAIYMLYRATEVSGHLRDRAFGIGLVLLFCVAGIVRVRSTRKTTREIADLESELHSMGTRLATQRRTLDSVKQEVDELTAAELFSRVPMVREGTAEERSFRVISDR